MTSLLSASFVVFLSGFAALAYQSVWLRSFRLLFGASTAASAAVLAIFMGGLGVGGLWLGRRAERSPNPLRFYGLLEAGITVSACLSPLLLKAARAVYYGLGGSQALGQTGSIAVRLLLALLVIGVPTVLMGGTLPATARAVARSSDAGRRDLGTLYGANTLGAVLGVLVTTFFLFEWVGISSTLYIAAGLNALASGTALVLSRRQDTPAAAPAQATPAQATPPVGALTTPPTWLVLGLAAGVGLAFLAMELVWYRMLGPLLGGSTYSFGLILAVALLGIGLGSLWYGRGERLRPPTLADLGLTCVLEALLIGVPLWLGDDLASVALGLQPLARLGFGGSVAVWAAITCVAVLPAAFVAGYQFPQLIALLGGGRDGIARHIGAAYLWNTVGSIAGSLGVGFFVLPAVGAVEVWRGLVLGLSALGVLCLVLAPKGAPRPRLVGVLVALVALSTAAAEGPTAFWRHSPIGFGRAELAKSPLGAERARRAARFAPLWEADGVESSVAISRTTGLAFYLNGKSDGHIRMDACTQVMSGLLGSMLVDAPKRALVVGLGTGSTAGWLGAVPGMEHVDVAELEPAILGMARDCAVANQHVLEQENVQVSIADGREMLLASNTTWDIVFSEPSNPYRAGIASLFSTDFYESVSQRLAPGGLFIQWLQVYEIDSATVRTVLTSLGSVFPYVETWQGCAGDLLLVASRAPVQHDIARVEMRSRQEPYKTALARTWGVSGAAGFYSSFIAGDRFVRSLVELPSAAEARSSDDWPILEFGFARGLGRRDFGITQILAAAKAADAGALPVGLDPAEVTQQRTARYAAIGSRVPPGRGSDDTRSRAREAWRAGDLQTAGRLWVQGSQIAAPIDLLVAGEGLASIADPRAGPVAEALANAGQVAESSFIRARLAAARGEVAEAATAYAEGFVAARSDPWIHLDLLHRAIQAVGGLKLDPAQAAAVWASLGEPFAVRLADEARLIARVRFSRESDFEHTCGPSFADLEPYPAFNRRLLSDRVDCYRMLSAPLLDNAVADLQLFDELDAHPLVPKAPEVH